MSMLDTLWCARSSFARSGIYLRDGSHYLFGYVGWPRDPFPFVLRVSGPFRGDPPAGQEFALGDLFQEHDQESGMTVIAGEGSEGCEGFVTLLDADGPVLWIAFFHDSNPFEKARCCAGTVVAENNLGERWTIDAAQPWRISVSGPI